MSSHYISTDQTELFEFHDSTFILDGFDGKDLSVFAEGLNISKNAEQNPKTIDLQIEKAHITIYGICDLTYEPGQTWKPDESGSLVPVTPRIIYSGKKALKRAVAELRHGIEVFSHEIADGDRFLIAGSGIEPYFEIGFKASKVVIEWDKYCKAAWYESRKKYEREITLVTSDNEIKIKARYYELFDPEDLFAVASVSEADPKEVIVGITYEGKEYLGKGNDPSGKESLIALQRQLPHGVVLKYDM